MTGLPPLKIGCRFVDDTQYVAAQGMRIPWNYHRHRANPHLFPEIENPGPEGQNTRAGSRQDVERLMRGIARAGNRNAPFRLTTALLKKIRDDDIRPGDDQPHVLIDNDEVLVVFSPQGSDRYVYLTAVLKTTCDTAC